MLGRVAVSEIQNLITAYKERFDKNNFIQNLLLDNMLLIDIYNRAKKLHIDTEVRRIVYLIETKYEKDNTAMEIVKGLFSSHTKDLSQQSMNRALSLCRSFGSRMIMRK